jgi:hypothetical protein
VIVASVRLDAAVALVNAVGRIASCALRVLDFGRMAAQRRKSSPNISRIAGEAESASSLSVVESVR